MPTRASAFWSSPVLASVLPVVAESRHVATDALEIERIAEWLAYEPFDWPVLALPLPLEGDPGRLDDFTLLVNSLNFAFSDFATGEKFQADRDGRRWSDSEGMTACLRNALDAGVPVLSGAWHVLNAG